MQAEEAQVCTLNPIVRDLIERTLRAVGVIGEGERIVWLPDRDDVYSAPARIRVTHNGREREMELIGHVIHFLRRTSDPEEGLKIGLIELPSRTVGLMVCWKPEDDWFYWTDTLQL